jgi:hypothetical protein
MQAFIRAAVILGGLVLLLLVRPGKERNAAGDATVRESAMDRAVREIHSGLERRKLGDKFALYRRYTGELLERSAGTKTFSDKTGNCRLAWIDSLLRGPVESLGEADRFTSQLHAAAAAPDRLPEVLSLAAPKLDLGKSEPPKAEPPRDGAAAVKSLAEVIAGTRLLVDRSLKPLAEAERVELRRQLYRVTTDHSAGHTFADAKQGRRVTDLLEKLDRAALLAAAQSLARLTLPSWLDRLAEVKPAEAPAVADVEGTIANRIVTPQGVILVGGPGKNTYHLERLIDVAAILDLGGDDTYLEGALSADRPVLIVIDLAGKDTYRGRLPGIQGAAILGASLLLDRAGDDTYHAADVAQGSALGGVGMLIDSAGNDTYRAMRRVQGQAVGGVGVLIDREGDDHYRAALWGQGVGGPLGLGLLEDVSGRDRYFAGGQYADGYDDSPGFGGWSQGVGIGPRGVANGGIGVLLDGGGDDSYEHDYFSHGGGYWFAVGLARDFGGNDERLGATRENFGGSKRTEPRFLRWGQGFGCHYALGFVIDERGNDTYQGDLAVAGFAWDVGVGVLCDAAGEDRYVVPSGGAGEAFNIGLAVLYDGAGKDDYRGGGLGRAAPTSDYHPLEKSGGNFAFLIDDGGAVDTFPQDLRNGAEHERGWTGGFFIDR